MTVGTIIGVSWNFIRIIFFMYGNVVNFMFLSWRGILVHGFVIIREGV